MDIGLWNIAQAQPERLAVIDIDGTAVSFGELARMANSYSNGLRERGLAAGDSIVMLLPNGVEMLAVYFGAVQIGLHVVPVNWHLTQAEVDHIVSDSGAKAFINGVDVARELQGSPERPDNRTMGAPMVYTSGTSGRPKGVRRPLTGADPDNVPPANIWFFGLFGLTPFDDHVHICGSPLYHTAVLNFVTISLQLGHAAVLMEKWDPEQMLALIERHQVTHTHMVPTQFRRLLALPASTRDKYDVSSMRFAIHGAAPCPQEVKRRMLDWWGPCVVEYYAASEGGGTLITAAEWLERPGSVGKAWPGSEIRVLDPDGNDMPVGEPGQVYLRMGLSTFEYHKDEAKTQAARQGNLFTVGDIGYLDADGYLYLCDRAGDLIISGGVNIYPAEIENELSCHPKVADVAVFGIPHEEWGEEVKAVVQPIDGVTADDAFTQELLAFAGMRLAKFKIPKTVDYVAELPRDPNGKLYKRRLRDPYWNERGVS